jgi:sensor histidine kinase YesM
MKKLSLYWRSQLLGWPIFFIVVSIFDYFIYHDLPVFLPFGVSMVILGLSFTHLLKISIKRLRILRKPFATQVTSLLALAILFAVFGTLIWMVIMIKLGLWQIEGNTSSEWRKDFLEEYFFNLFPVLLTFCGWVLIYFLFHYVRGVRREERLKTKYKLERAELEAKALRAQINPHFIFNCLNSIKSLIQDDEKDKSVIYLTTFSKLIRTLLNNADKKEISLYDEIETCRLYLEMEALRFDSKFSFTINVDESIDMKSVQIPALIIQPFIENAIWHGIVPRGTGGKVTLGISGGNRIINITVDDNGIGRQASMENKAQANIGHYSKGVSLTQSRLEIDNLLKQRHATIDIIDKTDQVGKAAGTLVSIRIAEE